MTDYVYLLVVRVQHVTHEITRKLVIQPWHNLKPSSLFT